MLSQISYQTIVTFKPLKNCQAKIMKQLKILIVFISVFWIFFLFSCHSTKNLNPAANGFNAQDSDNKAIKIADEVMTAMGGRKNWDETKVIYWDFFGARKLAWNKETGDVRITSNKDNYTVLMNIFTDKGQVMRQDKIVEHPDSVQFYLQKGKEAWINDSYWLVMPFKLKDSGVRLKYLGEGKTEEGTLSDILELTFVDVGKTPENKYHVYVDKGTKLVTQWDFYNNASDEKPRFKTPWKDYKQHGKILLSSNRGENYELKGISVYEKAPEGFFNSF